MLSIENAKQIVDQVMVPAALAAGDLLKKEFYKRDFAIYQKSGQSDLVTEIDLKSSNLINSILKGMAPNIPIIDEEDDSITSFDNIELAFIVDPLDGTLNFVHGLTEFTVSLGLVYKGNPLAGVVYHPILGDLFSGVDKLGSWKNGKEIKVGDEKSLSECLVGSGVPYDPNIRESGFIKPFQLLMNKVREIRLLGSAALALCYVASGQLSGFYEYDLSPWDVAGATAIILGAGGSVLPIKDNTSFIFDGTIVAGNSNIAPLLKEELNR